MQLTYKEIDADIVARIDALFPKKNCFIEVQPGNVVLPRKYSEMGESIRNSPTYPDDIWLVSYPRTGSTWAQEMVWLLGNKLDFNGAKKMQQLRVPIIELSALYSDDHHQWVANSIGNTVEVIRNLPRPRFARSHLTWDLLPKDMEITKPRIIYTARNPKDMCVSFYYYCRLMHGLEGPFEKFLDLFLEDHAPIGSYWKHVLPFWKRSTEENVLFLKYEDMKRNLPEIVLKCANFLKVDYKITDKDMELICEHLKFDTMKNNPAVNLQPILNLLEQDANANNVTHNDIKFIRKGEIGGWKNYMNEEMSARFDQWIEDNSRGSGLTFDYE